MRTTLSIEDDVAAELDALRAKEHLSLKEAVNAVLRRGLREWSRPRAHKAFRTQGFDMGECLVSSLDNVWEVLDEAEEVRGTRR